jgi:hypothetical protein
VPLIIAMGALRRTCHLRHCAERPPGIVALLTMSKVVVAIRL